MGRELDIKNFVRPTRNKGCQRRKLVVKVGLYRNPNNPNSGTNSTYNLFNHHTVNGKSCLIKTGDETCKTIEPETW